MWPIPTDTRSSSGLSDYREDLAWIHHAGFSRFASSASDGVRALLRAHGIDRGLIVDVGCGSGVLAASLSHAYDVFGIDASPAMIALARGQAPHARFTVGSFVSTELPSSAAIVAMGEVLNHGTWAEVGAFVERAAQRLDRGGLLLFDVAERGAYPAHDEYRSGGEDWSVIVVKESDGARLTRRVLTFREVDGEVRRDEEVHALVLHDRDAMLTMLRNSGFRVRVRRSYGKHRLPRGNAVYVATRE